MKDQLIIFYPPLNLVLRVKRGRLGECWLWEKITGLAALYRLPELSVQIALATAADIQTWQASLSACCNSNLTTIVRIIIFVVEL